MPSKNPAKNRRARISKNRSSISVELLSGRVDQAVDLRQTARAANTRLWVPYFYLAGPTACVPPQVQTGRRRGHTGGSRKREIRPCRVDTAETCHQIRRPNAGRESLAKQCGTLGVAGKNDEPRITPGWTIRSMIGGGVVVSDDSLLAFPIFNEVPEQRFAPGWIE